MSAPHAFEVRLARGQEELAAALEVRRQVFCDEQGVSLEAERDGRDDDAVHLVVIAGDQVVGTCRLLVSRGVARLGRMAVSVPWRGSGAGAALLAHADRAAAQEGAGAIRLHAQLAARGVYDRAGYTAMGDVFLEEGIEHLTMEKRVA